MLPFTDLPESLRRYQRLPKLEVLTSHLDDEAQRKPQRAATSDYGEALEVKTKDNFDSAEPKYDPIVSLVVVIQSVYSNEDFERTKGADTKAMEDRIQTELKKIGVEGDGLKGGRFINQFANNWGPPKKR